MKFADLIITHRGVLSKDFCEHLIKRFEDDDRKVDGVIGSGIRKDIKDSLDLHISKFDDWKEEDKGLFEGLFKYSNSYLDLLAKTFGHDVRNACPIINDSGYQIQRTTPGGKYTWHSDRWDCPVPDAVVGPHQAISSRIGTYIFYLNSEFEGGRTQFRFGEEIYSVVPETGMLLLFPATDFYIHQGEEVTSGTKYIATGWIHNYHWIDVSQERNIPGVDNVRNSLFSRLPQKVIEVVRQ